MIYAAAWLLLTGAAMRLPLALVFIAAGTGTLFPALAREARAESGVAPPSCAARVAPANGRTVPANVPALVLVATGFNRAPMKATLAASEPTWTDGFVTKDDWRDGSILFVPMTAPPEGTTFALTFATECSTAKDTATTAFTITKSVPLPTRTGVLESRAGSAQRSVLVSLAPADDLVPFLATSMFTVRTGGTTLQQLAYGEGVLDDGRVETPLQYAAACDRYERSTKAIAVEIQAHVAGTDLDPEPARADVTITCEPQPSDAVSAAARDGGVDDQVDSSSDGGCAMTANTGAPWFAGWLGLAFVATLLRARARRR